MKRLMALIVPAVMIGCFFDIPPESDLLFTSNRDTGSERMELDDPDSLIDISESGDHPPLAAYLPSFSPDGQFLVFGAIYEDPEQPVNSFGDILIAYAADGSGLFRVIGDPYMNAAPRWLPVVP